MLLENSQTVEISFTLQLKLSIDSNNKISLIEEHK